MTTFGKILLITLIFVIILVGWNWTHIKGFFCEYQEFAENPKDTDKIICESGRCKTNPLYCEGEVLCESEDVIEEVVEEVEAIITGYTTRPEEGTTCIGQGGLNLCHRYERLNLIACPAEYKIENSSKKIKGDQVEILGVIYLCADRMAPGLQDTNPPRFDIYFGKGEDRVEAAFEFGNPTLKVKIYRGEE